MSMKPTRYHQILRDVAEAVGLVLGTLSLALVMWVLCAGPHFLAGILENGPVMASHHYVVAAH